MKKEKIILSFIATLLGLVVAAVAFYFVSTKPAPPSFETKVIPISQAPIPSPSAFLNLSQPKDEKVVKSKIITVSGKTRSNVIIAILTNGVESIISPSISGNFSTQITLSNGQNTIEVIAIAADGETQSIRKTITYTEEEF